MTDRQSFVLLHGFLGSPEVFGDVELQLKNELGPNVSCAFHALTVSGHAAPSTGVHDVGGAPPISDTDFEAEVTRLLAEVPMEAAPNTSQHQYHLVGYSLGGRLALGMALREPWRFRSLTLISAHPGLASADARTERCQADEKWARLLEERGLNAFLEAWEKQPLFASQAHLSHAVLAEQHRLRLRHQPNELARALRQLSLGRMPNYAERIAELTLPVLLITGGLDAKFQSVAQAIRERLPAAKHYSHSGIGHNVVLENPSELARQLAYFALDNA